MLLEQLRQGKGGGGWEMRIWEGDAGVGASDEDWELGLGCGWGTGKAVLSRETGVLGSILGMELPAILSEAWREAISAGWSMGFNSGYINSESSGLRSAEFTALEECLDRCTP